ncbi:MAG: 30S ribosomal protein S18 [Candidatus Pacebacteria bacterium]|nr:30S ribosomal protein S18 [Candidatus Paceibacterota bacterium]
MTRSQQKNKKYFRKFKVRQLFEECQFCRGKKEPDYKGFEDLEKYLSRTGKITSRKVNSNCAKHQRRLAKAIKRARFLALLPFV